MARDDPAEDYDLTRTARAASGVSYSIRMKPQPLRTLLRAHPRTLPAFVTLGLVVSLAEALSIGLFVPILQEVLASEDAPTGGPLAAWLDAYASLFPADQRLADAVGDARAGALGHPGVGERHQRLDGQ